MSWELYSWQLQLRSPLHVGFHKIMHLYRTRSYIPGKLPWAALTARLAPLLDLDYSIVGGFLKRALHFSYLFVCDEHKLYLPQFTSKGLQYGFPSNKGLLSQNEFEKRFLSSVVSTAIDTASATAEEETLRHLEYIKPYSEKKPVYFKGLFWVREHAENGLSVIINDKNILFKHKETSISLKQKELTECLQFGGERKYGFGALEMRDFKKIDELSDFPGKWTGELSIELDIDSPVWGHVAIENSSTEDRTCSAFKIKGDIEPLVGRDWNSKGAGRKISNLGMTWVPGSILEEKNLFEVTAFGVLKPIC